MKLQALEGLKSNAKADDSNSRNSNLLVFGYLCYLNADQESGRARRVDYSAIYGKRQFVNCTKFNVEFVINTYLAEKKEKNLFFSFLQKMKTGYQILKKIENRLLFSETLKTN